MGEPGNPLYRALEREEGCARPFGVFIIVALPHLSHRDSPRARMRGRISPAVLSLVFVATAGCDERTGEAEPSTFPLQGEIVADGEYLHAPGHMLVVGDRLVLLDRSAPWVHVFRLPGGERIGSFGRDGDGPGEFRYASTIHADPREPRDFWIFDGTLNRFTRYGFAHPDSLPARREMVNVHGGAGIHFQPVWLNDSTIVSSGIFMEHPDVRLLVTDRAGRPTRTIGTLPEHPGAASIPTSVLQHAYEARFAVHPEHTRIAVGTRHADRLEIYRSDGTLVRRVTGASGFTPVFEVSQHAAGASMATGGDLRTGYLDLAATRRHVFALFSGGTRAELRGGTYSGKEVHVFDWSGERLATLALDARAFTIAVDTAGPGYLYAGRIEPLPSVARYRLPALVGE